MSQHSDQERIMALSGIFQAAAQVRLLARTGALKPDANQASLGSLFAFDAPDTESIFGGIEHLEFGLHTLINQLERPAERDMEIAQYVISVIHLGDQLLKSHQQLEAIGKALRDLDERRTDFELSESTWITQLEGIYQEHISELSPRILVKGEPVYLQNPETAARVRALLLAGIRAAILWRQTGGKKWQLLFRRSHIANIARHCLT